MGFTAASLWWVRTWDSPVFFRFEHPAPQGSVNTAPNASFSVNPIAPWSVGDAVTLDASATTDDRDPLEGLVFRWDFDGNGSWDTPFEASATRAWTIPAAGTLDVRVQARDRYGAASTFGRTLDVRFDTAPPGIPGEIRRIRLGVYGGLRVFDAASGTYWVAGWDSSRVVGVDLRTGRVIADWTTDGRVQDLLVAAGGRRIFAVLGYYGWSDPIRVDSFDVERGIADRSFDVPRSVQRLEVTSDGRFVSIDEVLHEFRLVARSTVDGSATGEPSATLSPAYDPTFTVHPDGRRVYVSEWGGGLLSRWSLSPEGRFTREKTVQQPAGDDWSRPFVSPDGGYLGTVDTIFALHEDVALDLAPVRHSGYYLHRGDAWDVARGDYFSGTWYGLRRLDWGTLEEVEHWSDDPYGGVLAKVGKWLFVPVDYSEDVDLRAFLINHPPEASAGSDLEVACVADRSAPVTLDGSASRDVDDEPDGYRDIVEWSWRQGGVAVASTPGFDATLPLGETELTLRVTDASGVSDTATVAVRVVDSIAPEGAVTWPAKGTCFGAAQLPVVVQDSFADVCDPAIRRTYAPGGGPAYAAHGTYDVVLTARDGSGNDSMGTTSFAIDLEPPLTSIQVLKAPLRLVLASSDDDGATGDVVHESLYLDECALLDGSEYGDRDGLLSDETIEFDTSMICRAASLCGRNEWPNPTVTFEAEDCAGNRGSSGATIPRTLRALPGRCRVGSAAVPALPQGRPGALRPR
jgi:hypothetical protein